MKVCRRCNKYTLQSVCSTCHQPTVEAYGSATTHTRGTALTEKQLTKWVQVRDLAKIPSSYVLVHTLGRCKFDVLSGDGAYADWMQRHFSNQTDPRGCALSRQLLYNGDVGNATNTKAARDLRVPFLEQFNAILDESRCTRASAIVLNWHLRLTGTPNGYTGRGINAPLIQKFREAAAKLGLKLVVIYTVHEYSQGTKAIGEYSLSRDALVGVNPDVHQSLSQDFEGEHVIRSRVPGLIVKSTHTTAIDRIWEYAGRPMPVSPRSIRRTLDYLDVFPSNVNEIIADMAGTIRDPLFEGMADLLQRLRLNNPYPLPVAPDLAPARVPRRGIVVFGMIDDRHSMETSLQKPRAGLCDNIEELCKAFDAARFPADFRIVVAGKEAKRDVVEKIKNLALTFPRLHFHGELQKMNHLSAFAYGISFDYQGYRENASAMANLIRNGAIMFTRLNSSETAQDMARRVAHQITGLENTAKLKTLTLMHQMPVYFASEPAHVGSRLDFNFRHSVMRATPPDKL